MPLSQSAIEAAYALIEKAAVEGRRCPQNDDIEGGSTTVVGLAHSGRIRIGIFAHNWRQITILQGEHAGKSTAPAPGNARAPYKTIDKNGTRTNRGFADTGAAKRTQPSAPRPLGADWK